MPTKKITIHDPCKTTPQQQRLRADEELQWRGTNSFPIGFLELPGGVFVGHRNSFRLGIAGNSLQPDPALVVVPNPSNTLISRYVFKISGAGCLVEDDPPPEIVIEANLKAKRKKPAKRK